MAQVKIVYRLSEAGRRASLLAGGDGRELQIVQVEATPELLALATVRPDGTAWIYVTSRAEGDERARLGLEDRNSSHSIDLRSIAKTYAVGSDGHAAVKTGWDDGTLWLDAPPAGLANWVLGIPSDNEERRQAVEAAGASERARLAEVDKTRAAEEAASAAEQAQYVAGWLADPARAGKTAYNEVTLYAGLEATGTCRVVRSPSPALEAEVKRREKARITASLAAAAAAATAAESERDAWIRAHGSERLRKCLDLGMVENCAGVYRDERLAHDYPGWVIDCKDTEEESEIRNPSLEALAALEEARKIDMGASLVKVRRKANEYDDGPTEWREAVRIDDLPGITSTKIFYRLI